MSNPIFTVNILGCTDLDLVKPLTQLVVRLSIIDIEKGKLLEKSNSNTPCISVYESTKYISPMVTKPVRVDSLECMAPFWDSDFIFNEPIGTVLKENVYLFFEIIDLYVPYGKHHFTPVSWAFLRLRSNDNSSNVGHPCILQMFSYPEGYNPTILGVNNPVFQLLSQRTKVSCRLTVEIKPIESQEAYDYRGRPNHFFHREIAQEDISALIKIPLNTNRDNIGGKDKINRVIRPALTSCTIPLLLAAQFPPGERGASTLVFNRNGDTLVAAVQIGDIFTIQFYDVTSFHRLFTIMAHNDIIYEISFSNDDNKMVSASADGMVKVWEYQGNEMILKANFPHSSYVYTALFHPQDNNFIVTGGNDGIVRFWDINASSIIKEFKIHDGTINSICFSPDGSKMYSGDSRGIINVWNTSLQEKGIEGIIKKNTIYEPEITGISITHLCMERSDFMLLVHTQDNMIRSFLTGSMTPSQRYNGIICQKFIMKSYISPDAQFVLSGSEDGKAYVWSARNGDNIAVPEWNFKFNYPLTAIAWNRTQHMIAFSSFGENQPIIVFKERP